MGKIQIKKKLKIPILTLLVLILLPSIYALTVTNTTFHSSVSNYTIHVDSITLDNVTVTNTSITFYNLTSVGSNFTNTNSTYDAVASFVGLDVGLVVRNLNTSINLFTSTIGNQDYNATFTPGQMLRIIIDTSYQCTTTQRSLYILVIIFSALAILIFAVSLIFYKGQMLKKVDAKTLITIFVMILIGVVFLQQIANNISTYCTIS